MNILARLVDYYISPPPALSREESELAREISNKVVKFFLDHNRIEEDSTSIQSPSLACAIILRQSKSWTEVKDKLDQITTSDADCKQWVSSWQETITTIIATRHEILKLEKKKRSPKDVQTPEEIEANYQGNLKKIEEEWEKIRLTLNSAIDNPLNETAKQKASTKDVAKHIHDYWLHLQVFSDWHEVSPTADKMNVRVVRFDPTSELEKIKNSSIKINFIVNETGRRHKRIEHIDTKPIDTKPTSPSKTKAKIRKITQTNNVELNHVELKRHLPKSSSPRTQQSSSTTKVVVKGEYNFVETEEQTMKLELIAREAIRRANRRLSQEESHLSDEETDTSTDDEPSPWRILFGQH